MLIKLLCCEATKYPTTHPIKNFQIEMLDFAGISKVAAANASNVYKYFLSLQAFTNHYPSKLTSAKFLFMFRWILPAAAEHG